MNLTKSLLSLSPVARVKIAGAASGLAVLLALGLAPATQAENSPQAENLPEAGKPPAAPRIAMQEAPAALRSYAYYPEQLAALQSLGQFQPIADAGQKTAVRPAAEDGKRARRTEPTAKLVAATAVPASLVSTALVRGSSVAAAPAAGENPVKILGLPLAGLSDTAARWREAATDLGGKIASFWR